MTEDNAMFHITLITVGKLKERYYAAAADEYYQIAKTFAEPSGSSPAEKPPGNMMI